MSTSTINLAKLDAATTAKVQVVSTPPLQVKDSEHVVYWTRRSTDKNPVAEAERYRGIIVNKQQLEVPVDACSSKFTRLLQSTIHELANDVFKNWVSENMQVTQVDAQRFSLDAVLAYWAEEKQRATIDAAKIIEFLNSSRTLAAMPKQKQETWLSKLPKIAAPSYRSNFSKNQCASIIAQISDADMQHPVAIFIMQRCNNVITTDSVEEAL